MIETQTNSQWSGVYFLPFLSVVPILIKNNFKVENVFKKHFYANLTKFQQKKAWINEIDIEMSYQI